MSCSACQRRKVIRSGGSNPTNVVPIKPNQNGAKPTDNPLRSKLRYTGR